MNSNTNGADINNFEPNKKKRSKLVPIISTVLGLVLISGGGLYYYSKSTNKSISSIFSFSKNKSDEEAYAQVLEKYKKATEQVAKILASELKQTTFTLTWRDLELNYFKKNRTEIKY